MAYILGIKLTALRGITVSSEIVDGVPQKCVTIPVEENFMDEAPNGDIFLKIVMFPVAPNRFRSSHKLMLDISRDAYNRYHKEGLMPKATFVGNAWVKKEWDPNKWGKSNIDDVLKG